MSITEPDAAAFTNAIYGGHEEIYTITVSGNLNAVDTTVTIRSIISDDGFATRTVLAELVNLDLEVEADAAAVKAAALAAVVSGTTMTGTLETQITATFPATVPAFFDTAGYVINSEIVIADDVEGVVTITGNGANLVFPSGL